MVGLVAVAVVGGDLVPGQGTRPYGDHGEVYDGWGVRCGYQNLGRSSFGLVADSEHEGEEGWVLDLEKVPGCHTDCQAEEAD